jgi:hypothetical protein
MIYIDNVNFLREKFPIVWNKVGTDHSAGREIVKVVTSKSGLPTLVMEEEPGKVVYLHSKYDPIQEAERLISQFQDVSNYEHVIFYGLGLGYHIQLFMDQHPELTFSIYEPNQAVFSLFLNHRPLDLLPWKKLENIYLEEDANDTLLNLTKFINIITTQKVLMVSLPSYERVFEEKYKNFTNLFRKMVADKRSSINIDIAFEKRWIVNSLLNIPEVIKTPNILRDVDKNHFQHKPALLVAAGPSLQEDIEEIRFIKENGLAYIFSVGSAISILLNNEIYPDAACTYDPQPTNYKVFDKVVKKGITSIPLIFGSSVGFETLLSYPGPKLHMLTNQDTLAPFLLKRQNDESLDTVRDAGTIAVVTLELLNKLGCNPVYLVGQNLAYKNDRLYPEGIGYYDALPSLSEEAKQQAIIVEDVYGGKVYTNDGFDSMRKQMEAYIQSFAGQEIINTTKGGAKIIGAPFVSLGEVLADRLKVRVVENDWQVGRNSYELEYINHNVITMKLEHSKLLGLLNETIDVLQEMEKLCKHEEEQKLERVFPKLDKSLNKVKKNKFHKIFLLPMNRVSFEFLTLQTERIRHEQSQIIKAKKVIQEFGKYILLCKRDLELLTPVWKKVCDSISM